MLVYTIVEASISKRVDYVRLLKCSIVFDWEKISVSSITQLNSKITPVTCHSKFCFNERSCQFHVLLVVKEHQKPLNLPAYYLL